MNWIPSQDFPFESRKRNDSSTLTKPTAHTASISSISLSMNMIQTRELIQSPNFSNDHLIYHSLSKYNRKSIIAGPLYQCNFIYATTIESLRSRYAFASAFTDQKVKLKLPSISLRNIIFLSSSEISHTMIITTIDQTPKKFQVMTLFSPLNQRAEFSPLIQWEQNTHGGQKGSLKKKEFRQHTLSRPSKPPVKQNRGSMSAP